METNVKKTLKTLSKEIGNILDQNDLSNEIGALIDYGEWSGSDPNFSKLIEKWKLTRPLLLEYVNIAKRYAKKWFDSYPKIARAKYSMHSYGSFEYRNLWYVIYINLNYVFMAGELQE